MSDGATEVELRAVERELGVELPAELRALLTSQNGWERWYGDAFLTVYGTGDILAVNQEQHGYELRTGFLAFASDGSRELIGFDLRQTPSPIVMIDISSDWDGAVYQAPSLDEFLAQLSRGEGLRWDAPHAPMS